MDGIQEMTTEVLLWPAVKYVSTGIFTDHTDRHTHTEGRETLLSMSYNKKLSLLIRYMFSAVIARTHTGQNVENNSGALRHIWAIHIAPSPQGSDSSRAGC